MACRLQQSTPGFHSSLVPRPCPLLLAGGMLFLEPILTVPLKTIADNWVWRLRLPLSAFPPGFPSSSEELFSACLWNQPITKGAWRRTFQTWVSLEPPAPLGHNQGHLHYYSCILLFFNQSIFCSLSLKIFFKKSGPFLKSLLNLLPYCFCFMLWFFGAKACGVLAPWPEAHTSCIGKQSLNRWTTRELREVSLNPLFQNINMFKKETIATPFTTIRM